MEDWSPENFGFAFNDKDFSDRVLHIEVIPDESLPPNVKKLPFMNAHNSNTDSCVGVQVKTLHISSPILAIKSPFFYKLFKNGMMESQQRDVSLRIYSSEEAALTDLLNFVYTDTLSATTWPDLLGVLMAADKFGVTSCMKYCVRMLLKIPLSLEPALLYLGLPLNVSVVQPLIDASQYYLAELSGISTKEAMGLPLSALEIVLGREDSEDEGEDEDEDESYDCYYGYYGLQVKSEDDVFEFILEWGRAHYPDLNERREILTKRLAPCICFPYMSSFKLKEALACADFDHEQVSKLVMEALLFKSQVPYGQHNKGFKGLRTAKNSFSGHLRQYTNLLVKVVKLECPWPRCTINIDLKKGDCSSLFPSNKLYSEPFLLGGRWFYVVAQCGKEVESSAEHFGLFLFLKEGSENCEVGFEVAAMRKRSMEFESQGTVRDFLTEDECLEWWDPFQIPWITFMSEDSEYFIDGILHLRADLTIINSQGT